MKPFYIIVLLLGFFSSLFAANEKYDFEFIDDYLSRWDSFAQGDNSLVPSLKRDKPRFETELSDALVSGDKRAMSRAIFSAVVQVDGFIPLDSPIGQGIQKESAGGIAIFTSDKGEKMYFAGDLYDWWLTNRNRFSDYPLFNDYMKRDFAKDVVLKLYESAKKNK